MFLLDGDICLIQLKKQQLHRNHVSPDGKAHGQLVMERSTITDDTCLTNNDKKTTHHRHTNSADEGIAELDGPTSVPVLLELLREKDDRIQVLGENLLRVRFHKQILIHYSHYIVSFIFHDCMIEILTFLNGLIVM